MADIRAVLFDFGNTLFGHDPLAATIERCAAGLAAPLDSATAAEIAAEIDTAAHTEAELSLLRDLDDAVWDDRWRHLYGIADRWVPGLGLSVMTDMHDPRSWVPFASTVDTVRALAAAGIRVGIVSNTGWNVRAVFNAHGIGTLVHHFVLSYEVGSVKPDPTIFVDACRHLGVRPDETLMVGDDVRADSGAAAAGLRVLLLPIVAAGSDNGIGLVASLVGVRPG